MQKKYRRMLIMLVYILVVSSTIAYSALTSSLQLNAEAKLRTISDIRVTGISLSSANGGTLQYESSYDVNTITSGFVLPTTDSSITYKVTVTNNGTIDQTIYDILTQSSNNSGLYYEISGYNVRDVIGFKTVVEFYITYKTTTPSEEPINVVNKFNFKKVYHVTFEAKGGTSITDGIKYEGVDLDLSTFTSTKQGYILSGWTDEQDGTTVKYQTNGTYTLDRDLILYAVWEGNPNTSYSVNHYVHDLGTNTYTLDSTDNLTGTTDSTLTLASLKKTIPGFTYVDGYLTGGTTKPTEGAVTTTTVLADGSRVINLYYRRNYLYVQYHVNGGQLAEQHGSHFGIANSLVTSTGNTTPNKFWVGVYGSKVNAVTNANTYAQGTAGLDNYNNPNYLNLEKTGYTGKSGQEWNTNASGTGTSYSQVATTYDANTFGGADLSTGDQVVTLYVNWVPVDYEIMYDLQDGTLATSNPATYNIETNTFTLNNPTLEGYTFTGWTGSNGETPETTVTIPTGSTGAKAYIANWQVNTYTVTADANGGSIPSTTGWTGTGATATKSVTYDSQYGTLPTPTRDGYTFKGWANGIESELPSNYQQLDYIESTRTQYIDTGYIPKTNTKIELDLSFNGDFKNYNTYGGNPAFLGVQDSNTQIFVINYGGGKTENNILYPWFNKIYQYDGQGADTLHISDVIRTNRNTLIIENGNITYGTVSRTISSKEVNQINSMYIFGRNNQMSTSTQIPYFTNYNMRVYDMKVYESNILVRHYVPVIDKITHKLGLYETVNEVFYSNETLSEFETEYTTSETIVKTSKNHTLKAIWEINNYEITYDLQGGSLATENPTTYNVETDTFTLNNPTLTGYTFTGWTGSNGNTPQTIVTIPVGSTGDKAYIANWTANSYTVTADANGGSIPSTTGWTGTGNTATKSVTYDSTYGTLPTPTRNGYTFKGWNGKNLLNINIAETTKNGLIASVNNNLIRIEGENTNHSNDYVFVEQKEDLPQLRNGTRYTLSTYNKSTSESYIQLNYFKENDQTQYPLIRVESGVGTFTVYNNYFKTYAFFIGIKKNVTSIDEEFRIQLEEGTAATPYEPYYVTSSTNVTQDKNHTLKAIWDLKESTLLPGQQFNAKIKELAGNQDATYQTADNNITSIVRSNSLTIIPTDDNVVSTSDSNTPTYAWFDSNTGTLYYYTDAVNLYMNANAWVMFYDLRSVTNIDLSDINTSRTTNMQSLFNNDNSLTSVDVSNFNTSNVTNMSHMFYHTDIETLDISSFDMSNVTNTANMLTNMTSLESLKTPDTYPTDSSVKITLPKLMIDSNGNEYTKLNSSSPTETMLYTPATFLPGQEFNIKIKQLAGNSSPTTATADTNITNIVRTNTLSITPTNDNIVSTSDSNTPIYAWFDNGIIYYYSEAADLYLNSNANYMFMNLRGLTSLDIDTINTNKTTQMAYTFYNLVSLQSLNLSNFDTSNVSLMQGLFYGCNSLTSLDISTFDMDSVTNTNSMIGSMASLESLKTPKVYPTDSRKITLPKLMIDSNGNEYTELNSSSPTETMLYTPATFLPGQEFNAKIKQLAGNTNATYNTFDTNITNILRANSLPSGFTPTSDNIVSMNDSYIPIYAWYDNGTLYYYSESSKLYMNSYAYAMFQGLRNVLNIDLTGINTTQVTEMTGMFTFDTHLISLDLSNFDTSKVRQMQSMFHSCASLQELDLSSFNMTKVTNTSYLFYSTSSLESLKTPKVYPSEAVIQMPKTLYDSSGNGWSVLDSSSPTETWLHKMVCKRATTLHTETCSQTDDSLYCSGAGYTVGGSKNTSTITYGSLGTNATTLNSGDAFTCDVNGDGTFNELTERFYYVGDYYNTTTKQFETDTGVLIYYNNVSGGTPNNTTTSAYDSSGENWHGPVTAISQLPTTSQWTNVSLKNNTRAILTYYSTNTTSGGTLPSDFSYSGYSARLLTVQEINHSLNRSLTNYAYRLDDIAPYYFENTSYSSPNLKMRTWLETTGSDNIGAFTIMTANETRYTNVIYGATVNIASAYSVRPAIEVNKNFLNKKVNAYLITYDTNGGSENTTQTVTVGDSLGSLSVPTKEGYTFNGWYTAASGGEEVTTATVPTATTTYYAHWTPINYNITYDLDGGEVETANPTTYNPDSNSITLNNPTKTGYTFAGWSGGKNYINPSLMKVGSRIQVDNNGKISATNKTTDGRAWNSSNSDIKLTLPAGTYTLSMIFDKTTSHQYAQYHIYLGTTSIYTSMLNGKTVDTKTFTLSEETEVGIEMKLYEAEIYLQIEEGSTATSYEPYVSNETTLTIPSGSVGNRKYTANWTANSYTVTADANGGSIPSTNGWTGTGNTATKSVTYDSQYGTLPTPTRNGYTFKGWNGKNLIKPLPNTITLYGITITPQSDGSIVLNGTKTGGNDYLGDITSFFSLKANVPYIISIGNYDSNIISNYGLHGFGTMKSINWTVDFGSPGIHLYINDGTVVSNVRLYPQIEEGTTATPYEPYYVTSSTNVTQDKNHTLKAKWEMNTYEITYDLQGGTLASSNPATYNVETNTFTLNNPTLTGQTFIGWTGSNGNTPEVNVTIPVGSTGDKAYVAHFSPIYDPETRIRSLNTIGTSIADDDPDSNLRFIGSNPNNYVSFNGQKWRIIGVFDGKLKIIGDSIGNYSWDTSRNTVNNGYGINQWGASGTYTGADLMKLLNPGYSSNNDLKCNTTVTLTNGVANCGDNTDSNYTSGLVNNSLWWNAESGYCYNYGNYQTTVCDFTTTGLQSNTARNMIDNATWYLGSNPVSDNVWGGRLTASYLYNMEKSNNSGKQCSSGDYCNDDVTRTTTWQGKVGLLYPSDYAYATSGGVTHNRNTCLTTHVGYVSNNSVQNWDNTYTECKNNDWLLNTQNPTWSISPSGYAYSDVAFNIAIDGYIRQSGVLYAYSVRPVVYLKSSIKFTTGDGSYNSPFNLIDTE